MLPPSQRLNPLLVDLDLQKNRRAQDQNCGARVHIRLRRKGGATLVICLKRARQLFFACSTIVVLKLYAEELEKFQNIQSCVKETLSSLTR
jgi:hypothetical protein